MTPEPYRRRHPIGAECSGGLGVDFRVWAPRRRRVEIAIESGSAGGTLHACTEEPGGYFRACVRDAQAGTLYRFKLDGGNELYPDPSSRAQPSGPHGPSQVVDPSTFEWGDRAWGGIRDMAHVVYEMHIGTYTHEGTWAAATTELQELARLGVTILEVMPIAEFPGRFGWGYDGVNLFAPMHAYGTPDDVRRFVDRAHGVGLGVILDVVYNHLGPDGNYLPEFSAHYLTEKHKTDWGPAINYDGEGSAGVREFVLTNARYWIEEFHFDGFRLDATQNINDESSEHILSEFVRVVREASGGRGSYVVAENESQVSRLVRPREDGGYGLDALWNDDLHHTAHVALTGHSEAYYSDYGGTPQEFVSAIKHGFLYQGQHYSWQKQRRGTSALDLSPKRFVVFLENHDQVANSATGERLHARVSRGRHRALTTLILLGRSTPMLFQGEEFAASSPFLYFADHEPDLAKRVRLGRSSFLAQFPSIASPEVLAKLAPPEDRGTFERCKLDFAERTKHAEAYTFYRELIRLRRHDPVFGDVSNHRFDGAVLTESAFLLCIFGEDGDDRLVLVNLGPDTRMPRAPEPLLAPPDGRSWGILLSTEDQRFGGAGTPVVEFDGAWQLLGEAAVVLRAIPSEGP
jgi:maltooligosyltrehalose trehalohydrolase